MINQLIQRWKERNKCRHGQTFFTKDDAIRHSVEAWTYNYKQFVKVGQCKDCNKYTINEA